MKTKVEFQKELESGGIPFTDAQINYLYGKYQTDKRTVRKYDMETEIPVGALSTLFGTNGIGQRWRDIYKEGVEYQVINTKKGKILGKIIFYLSL